MSSLTLLKQIYTVQLLLFLRKCLSFHIFRDSSSSNPFLAALKISENSEIIHHNSIEKTRLIESTAQPITIVCNTQPFSGSPGATLIAVIPYLRGRLNSLGPVALHYVGSSLTIDFQKLPQANWDGSY
ncbi:hypothetical protein V8C34DRAFT_284671 [Trichoderma compactum]